MVVSMVQDGCVMAGTAGMADSTVNAFIQAKTRYNWGTCTFRGQVECIVYSEQYV